MLRTTERYTNVSIHALTRRATSFFSQIFKILEFQSTPSRGGRLLIKRFTKIIFGFNPRPHAEGDLAYQKIYQDYFRFQSTPSRGGRHVVSDVNYNINPVSIHALTRRATGLSRK